MGDVASGPFATWAVLRADRSRHRRTLRVGAGRCAPGAREAGSTCGNPSTNEYMQQDHRRIQAQRNESVVCRIIRTGAAMSDWLRLHRSLRGDLLRPADACFEQARRPFWAQFDTIVPAAVAMCETPADVAACLAFCQDNDLPATPRSGGHSTAGYSTTTGVVIDVSRMSQARTHNGDTALVGPGARQVDALTALWRDGVTIPAGLCPTVCVGGFVGGGGFGWTTRSAGMACDQLVSAEVVLADGRVVWCSAAEEPELFWALRGAGSGNFGVITECELRTQRIPRIVTYQLAWAWDDAAAVIEAWQRWLINGPDELSGALGITAAGFATPDLGLVGAWQGDPTALERELNAFVAEVGRPPLHRATEEASYLDAALKAYGCADTTPEQRQWVGQNPDATIPREHFTLDRSRLIERGIPPGGVEEMLAAFDGDRRAGQVRLLSVFALGGQVNRLPPDANAYVHRDAELYVAYVVGLDHDVPDDEDRLAAQAWTDTGFAVIDRYSNGESYQNFMDPRLEHWAQAYYAENYPRLTRVKRQYDPYDFFSFAQSIGLEDKSALM
jgi:FAD/FMN-containing dehydrogenase